MFDVEAVAHTVGLLRIDDIFCGLHHNAPDIVRHCQDRMHRLVVHLQSGRVEFRPNLLYHFVSDETFGFYHGTCEGRFVLFDIGEDDDRPFGVQEKHVCNGNCRVGFASAGAVFDAHAVDVRGRGSVQQVLADFLVGEHFVRPELGFLHFRRHLGARREFEHFAAAIAPVFGRGNVGKSQDVATDC